MKPNHAGLSAPAVWHEFFHHGPFAEKRERRVAWHLSCRLLVFFLVAAVLGAAQTVSPTSLSFGNQAEGTASAVKKVTLTNKTSSAVAITGIATNLADYTQTNTCPASLAAHAACTISVTFTPAALGVRDGTLTVTDTGVQTVSLSGTGIVDVSAPSTLAFGNQVIGVKSAAKSVTVTNNQAASLTITSIATNLADYAITANTCPLSPATLAAKASCKITLVFTPSVLGSDNGTLTITDNANNSPTVSLTGTGVATVSVAPSSLTFGGQALGTTSSSQVVTLVNNQSKKLTITSITSSLADFGFTSTCPLSPAMLAAGASCSVSVSFSPAATGTRTGTLSFVDNVSGSPQTVALSGTGSPAALVSIAVTPANPSVTAGTTEQFTATGTYTDNSTQNLTNSATWSTANTAVATINAQGLARGVAVGNTTVTATSGSISGSTAVNVTPAALVSIAVTPANPSVSAGTQEQFTATGTYTDNSTQNLTNSVTWGSSNTAVATVSATGLATTLTAGTATVSATSGAIAGTTLLTVTPPPPILSRVPARDCLIESEASLSVACTLSAQIPAGDGVAVFITSTNPQSLASGSLTDSQSNTYSILGTPSSGGYGTIYAAYSLLATTLQAGNAITLSVPGADSWGLSIYDLGPMQGSQPDVGVTFQNAYVGLAGVNNPATGVPGWWTGQTAATTGTSDMCLAALGVGDGGSGDGAPAAITSYSLDGNFIPVSVSQYYAQSDPNYINGGTVLAAYAQVPAGTSVQSHVIGPNPNTAPAVLYCFSEGPGAVTQTPQFTGNYCTGAATCTINNVTAGNMLIVSGHTFSALPPTPITVTDTQIETVTFDQINNVTGLSTWHISPVANSGSHTITVNDANDSSLVINVMEVSGQASGNPVESVAQASLASGSLGTTTVESSVPNDLLYGWGRASQGSDEGEGFNAVRTAPTAEYAIAPGVGAQTVTILPRPPLPATTVGDQAMAIRPAGTSAPPITGPSFTGNYSYCQPVSSCTINNVAAGDMLVVSFFWWGLAGDVPVAVDNLGEVVVNDRNNDTDGTIDLALWHIAGVANAGSHTISISNFTQNGPPAVMISEYSAQSASPIDAVTGANGSGTSASASVITSQGSDWIYVSCASPQGTAAADNYAQIASGPTVELRPASSTAGTEDATCALVQNPSTWVIQELAIKH